MKAFLSATLLWFSIVILACKKPVPAAPVSVVKPPAPAPIERFSINQDLVTSTASAEARKLYQYLRENYGKKIFSGVMTLNSFDETSWLKESTGKEPAIVGLDFMHCNRAYTWYNDDAPVNDAKSYWLKKGIPVFTWHWRDPSRQTEEFYSNKTAFDVSRINDESSAEYKAMLSDIDFIASKLKLLQQQNVPVIWRPLHEAAGGWFWWGAKGAQPCRKLYQLMFDRMVNHHQLNNLIWVWTNEPNDQAWYPGDEYVDIIGRDIYKKGDHTSQVSEFEALNTMFGSRKMIALSEVGSIPDVDNLIKDKAAWLWFMPWYGDFTRKAEHNSVELWKKMFASDYVITLDEMPDLKR